MESKPKRLGNRSFPPDLPCGSFFAGLSLTLLFLVFSAQAGTKDPNFQANILASNIPREKIYLHIDREVYSAGEDIWFKVYLVDANTHQSEAQSKVVYVNLLDPTNKITATKFIKITDGCGTGDFKLPFNSNQGEYVVQAYTNFMRNFDDAWFFRRMLFVNALQSDSIHINPGMTKATLSLPHLKPDLQFFPDGGYMVDGMVNRIGFKAVGSDGKGIDLSGTILDNSGEKVLDFQSVKFGMGMLKFVPQLGQHYKARIIFNDKPCDYDLPASLASGVVMEIIEQKDSYAAIVRSSAPNGVNFKFVGRQKNRFVGNSQIVNNLDGAKIIIPKNILEEGIAQFTLYDNQEKPLCERLVFVEKTDISPVVTFSLPGKEYRKREIVELEIALDQGKSHSTNANTSVSVSDISTLNKDNSRFDIRSYLLLSSDLRGEIDQPGYYFYSDDPQRKHVLDLLMMTQGWRQFILNDSLKIEGGKLKYTVEKGINIGGCVRRFSVQGKPAKAEVSLIYSNKDEMVYNQTETDNQGHFLFDDFNFSDSTSIIIQAKKITKDDDGIKNPNANFYIAIDTLPSSKQSPVISKTCQSEDTVKFIAPKNSLSDAQIDSILHSQQKHIVLDEVTITARRIERMSKKRSMYFEPSQSLDFKEMRKGTAARNILDALQGRIPGLEFNNEDLVVDGGNSINQSVKATFGTPPGPLFLLDGLPVSKSAILSIPVDQVDFVDVLKRSRATIFGPAGSHGVIAVYTLSAADNLANSENNGTKCILNFTHPGYSVSKKFYEPVYSTPKTGQDKPDYRSTIYWNPEVKLTDHGRSKISFYTSDLSATYKVELEGITPEGVPVKSETFFEVK